MTSTERVKKLNTVVDNAVDVGNMSFESVEAFGEAVSLVVDCTCGESRFGEENGGELEEPARLAGESVDNGDDSGDWSVEWGPPLSEELEAAGVGDELGGVTH